MKRVVVICFTLCVASCAKYPPGAIYNESKASGLLGRLFKNYEFLLPEIPLADGAVHEWCFENLSFNAGNPQFHVLLSSSKEIAPSDSGVIGSVEIKEEGGAYRTIASGLLGDPDGGANRSGKWCSESYHYAQKPSLKTMSYESCNELHVPISRWGSYCMRFNVTSIDPALSGEKGQIVLSSSWK